MNIEDLTIKEVREISSLFNVSTRATLAQSKVLGDYTGKYVIVRTRNEGINCGFVKAHDDTGIVLTDARRIYYHKPKDKTMSWYEGVSISGLSKDSKISNPVKEKAIIEDYSITVCSDTSKESLVNHKGHEQN